MDRSDSYMKYIDGILTFDEAFEGMTPNERYGLLNAQSLELPERNKMITDLEAEQEGLRKSIEKYKKEMEYHINRLDRAKQSLVRLVEDSKKNLEKYSNVLEAGIPKE